ncbi:hypothetical protein BDP27DRAFT_1373416 [Rhodocollybia butyracea]|uniref:Uncharacterized protein n=1 Tax=Rhodocollybia butyracea TaxID=206335 RepID=A0A9P5P613_9AGAR|nr:hypothetical protein BDP27DRAFT_1373416 [Rhodocollybia butyracea]
MNKADASSKLTWDKLERIIADELSLITVPIEHAVTNFALALDEIEAVDLIGGSFCVTTDGTLACSATFSYLIPSPVAHARNFPLLFCLPISLTDSHSFLSADLFSPLTCVLSVVPILLGTCILSSTAHCVLQSFNYRYVPKADRRSSHAMGIVSSPPLLIFQTSGVNGSTCGCIAKQDGTEAPSSDSNGQTRTIGTSSAKILQLQQALRALEDDPETTLEDLVEALELLEGFMLMLRERLVTQNCRRIKQG